MENSPPRALTNIFEMRAPMADLSCNIAGVQSPNPFWLASAPPTNSGYQVMKAFDQGWGGAVWKTLGVPIINTSSRYGAINYRSSRMIGLNNIELISDRPLKDNLREIEEVKKYQEQEQGRVEKPDSRIIVPGR